MDTAFMAAGALPDAALRVVDSQDVDSRDVDSRGVDSPGVARLEAFMVEAGSMAAEVDSTVAADSTVEGAATVAEGVTGKAGY